MNEQDARDRILELVQEGLIDPEYVILAFVKWNTNDDIEEMCRVNEIVLWEDEDEEGES
jgi:ferritin